MGQQVTLAHFGAQLPGSVYSITISLNTDRLIIWVLWENIERLGLLEIEFMSLYPGPRAERLSPAHKNYYFNNPLSRLD
jgi:hypothetical protein